MATATAVETLVTVCVTPELWAAAKFPSPG